MESEGSRPRRGRPPKSGERKRASFNTRLRDSLKSQLEAAAALAGRSLSEEIEFRLEHSLDDQRFLFVTLEAAFGREISGLALLLGLAMSRALRYAEPWVGRDNERWWSLHRYTDIAELVADVSGVIPAKKRRSIEDPFIFDQAAKAAETVLHDLRPEGNPAPPRLRATDPELLASFAQKLGILAAEDACLEVVHDDQLNTIVSLTSNFFGEAVKKRLADRLAERGVEDKGGT